MALILLDFQPQSHSYETSESNRHIQDETPPIEYWKFKAVHAKIIT